MLKNVFHGAYYVAKDGFYLAITRDSCFKISDSTHHLISKLPLKGSETEYLQKLSELGVKEPEGILRKLISINCLRPADDKFILKKALKALLNPAIELIPCRFQEKMFSFVKKAEFKDEDLFRFSLTATLAGLVFAIAFAFYDAFSPSGHSAANGFLESIAILAFVLLGIFIHESGHSIFACLSGIGFRPIGFSIYLIYPVFYANVSGINELELKPKLAVNLAGLAFQSVYTLLFFAGYLITGNSVLYAATKYLSYLLIFNLNPLINTDSHWCYKDIIAAYKDSGYAWAVRRFYTFASVLFSGYLLYIAFGMLIDTASFISGNFGGVFSGAGSGKALLNTYILILLLKGISSRLKSDFKTA